MSVVVHVLKCILAEFYMSMSLTCSGVGFPKNCRYSEFVRSVLYCLRF